MQQQQSTVAYAAAALAPIMACIECSMLDTWGSFLLTQACCLSLPMPDSIVLVQFINWPSGLPGSAQLAIVLALASRQTTLLVLIESSSRVNFESSVDVHA
jgi:hypothetical protein